MYFCGTELCVIMVNRSFSLNKLFFWKTKMFIISPENNKIAEEGFNSVVFEKLNDFPPLKVSNQ